MAEKIILADGHLKAANYYIQSGFLSKRRALRWASYSDNTPVNSIFGRDDVSRYVEAAKQRALARAELTKETIMAELAVLATTDGADLIDVDPDTGEATLDMTNLTPAHRKIIAGFKLEKTEKIDPETGQVVAVLTKFEPKFTSKLEALAHASRILGLNVDRLEVSGAALVQELHAGRERARLKNIEGKDDVGPGE